MVYDGTHSPCITEVQLPFPSLLAVPPSASLALDSTMTQKGELTDSSQETERTRNLQSTVVLKEQRVKLNAQVRLCVLLYNEISWCSIQHWFQVAREYQMSHASLRGYSHK